MRPLFALGLLAACSAKPAPIEAVPVVVVDAGIDGITVIGSYDPESAHLDDDGSGATVRPPTGVRRAGRPIEITLRSSPPRATVFVDGKTLGPAPQFWAGEASVEHTFSFSLRGHGTQIYRFVPVASGVIHARLEPVATGEDVVDAGVPQPDAKSPITPPAPPATVVTPRPDAAIATPDGAAPDVAPTGVPSLIDATLDR